MRKSHSKSNDLTTSRLTFAEAAIEGGTHGADKATLDEALSGLGRVITDQVFGSRSSRRAQVQDLVGTLCLMKANLSNLEADFEDAITASADAVSDVWSELKDSKAIGAHRHLGEAYRDRGMFRRDRGKSGAESDLTKAIDIFTQVEAAYRAGTSDGTTADSKRSADATADEITEIAALIAP